MTLYVDSSALLKRYVDEHDSSVADDLMRTDAVLVTSRLTEVEVRRNLTRLLDGDDLDRQRRALATDLDSFGLVALNPTTTRRAGHHAAHLRRAPGPRGARDRYARAQCVIRSCRLGSGGHLVPGPR